MTNAVTTAWNAVLKTTAGAKNDQQSNDTDLRRTSIFLGGAAFAGYFGLLVWSPTWPAFAVGVLILSGAGLVGGVLGLLFGIPKSVSDPGVLTSQASTSSNTRSDSVLATSQRSNYAANTNLEQISDWLTKIIVGVGLTELPAIRGQFYNASAYFGAAFKPACAGACTSDTSVVAAALIVYGLAGGFLAGYLLTRMFLQAALVRVDDAILRRNRELTTQIAEVKESTEAAGQMQGEIYNDLYDYEGQGFDRAIRKIGDLFKSAANRRNPALWTYLAAAHGQAYRWALAHSSENSEEQKKLLDYHRDQAYAAANTALQLGDGWKPILQGMWDINHPTKKEGRKGEDDLEVFYADEAFKRLLGDDATSS